MRLSNALILCLLLPTVVLPQGRPVLQRQAELEFGDLDEHVVADKYLGGENRLVLVGRKVIRVLDVANARFLESRPIEVPKFKEDRPREISPDGRRMIIFGNYDSQAKEDKVKRPPSVWNLETGEKIASLDQTTKPIRAALWSKNGKTLATSSDQLAPLLLVNYSSALYNYSILHSVELSFWDGETLKYKNSLPTDKASWWHLTEDGDECIYATGEITGTLLDRLLHMKYLSPSGPINVWDINEGKIERTITAHAGNVERRIRQIDLSPDGRFLALVVQPPNSKDTERRLSVWEIDRSNASGDEIRPRYEIEPTPKMSEAGAIFSPSGKYFALDVGRNLQIYETRTGIKKFELPNFDRPRAWLTDEVVYNDNDGRKMEAFDVATGKPLYQQKLVYRTYTYSTGGSYDPNDSNASREDVTEVLDETKIFARPGGTMFLTYSNQYVKVFDSRTGELLQTLVAPPMEETKKGPRPIFKEALVYKAGWSDDGKTLYVINSDRRTISLWRLL